MYSRVRWCLVANSISTDTVRIEGFGGSDASLAVWLGKQTIEPFRVKWILSKKIKLILEKQIRKSADFYLTVTWPEIFEEASVMVRSTKVLGQDGEFRYES